MTLSSVIESAVETAFGVFDEINSSFVYHDYEDNGFDDPTDRPIDVRLIKANMEQKDINNLSFRSKIQPTDVLALVPGKDLSSVVRVKSGRELTSSSESFRIVDFEVDPYKALYILLLRK